MTFATGTDLQAAVEVVSAQYENPTLVGPNWIIETPYAKDIAPALGGTVSR